ncbi:MAG: NAD(P)-binding domain-containing protein, partial [Eggerthellaceae bacterium]|nr:NAD(P)-binding domain-containing protein [Eggerthellaceae bacterium]
MATFYFAGNRTVGDYVRDRLEAADCFEVFDPSEASVCFTYFTSEADVETVYLDSDGLFQVAQQDALVVDLSSISPSFARELSALAQVSGILFVEAPIALIDTTIADAFCSRDNVTCCVAGTDDAIRAAWPYLDLLFSQIHTCGGAGSAQLAHAAYAMQLAALLVTSAEAYALFNASAGEATGAFSDSCTHEGCGCASSKCPPALTEESKIILGAMCEKRLTGGYSVEMLRGDLDAALRAAEDAELTFPVLEACDHLLELLAVVGGSDLTPAAVALDYASEEEAKPFGIEWKRAEAFSFHEHDHDDDDGD